MGRQEPTGRRTWAAAYPGPVDSAVLDIDARAAAHQARLRPFVEPHLARRATGTPHPVHDFLFTYYSFRPAQLLRWTPSSPTLPADKRVLVETLLRLLRATASRPAHLGCFGLHEWAMVYRASATRHPRPLRLGGEGTDAVVEAHRIRCSHFDAFRFFTPAAVPLNSLRPGRDDRADFEQPGCLHAGMDLYKWAHKLVPVVSSDLVMDCFELARDIRSLDMRAAPYDLRELGYEPVRIETAEGKAQYAAEQRAFSVRGQRLRERLVEAIDRTARASVRVSG